MMANIIPLHPDTGDFLTVLSHPQAQLSKAWKADGTITPYSEGKYFNHRRVRVDNIVALSEVLTRLQDTPKACVVRGSYRGEDYASANEPEHKPGTALRRVALFDDALHHWLLIEVDNFEPLSADPVVSPVVTIEEYISASLPEAFHTASYHWQLSNSAGSVKNHGVLKAHLWFWSETAYNSAQLKAWATAGNIDTDKSVFNPVQIHYTAAPTFEEGVADPVPVRCGFVEKARQAVPLEMPVGLPTTPERAGKQERIAGIRDGDPAAARLNDLGMVKALRSDGGLNITCPHEDQHSTGAGAESSTIYYLPNTGGYATGHFKCLHDSCSGRTDADFLEAIGITVLDDFEEVLPSPEEAEPSTPRFTPIPLEVFAAERTKHKWLVKNVLPAADLGVIYGASGSGKTFMAFDLACAISLGTEWRGRKTSKGKVLYVVAEGVKGFRERANAYSIYNGVALKDLGMLIIREPLNLLEKKDVQAFIKGQQFSGDIRLVIIDTLAKTTAGANENSSEDMGRALAHCQVFGSALKCMVLLVHHSGKDEARGARGWSGIKGALDVELEVVRADDARAMTVTKMKDGEGEGDEFGFKLQTVNLWPDEDEEGTFVTSCVLEHNETSVKDVRAKKRKLGDNEKAVLKAFHDGCVAETGIPVEEVVQAAMVIRGLPETSKAISNLRCNLLRAAEVLVRNGELRSEHGMLLPQESSMQ